MLSINFNCGFMFFFFCFSTKAHLNLNQKKRERARNTLRFVFFFLYIYTIYFHSSHLHRAGWLPSFASKILPCRFLHFVTCKNPYSDWPIRMQERKGKRWYCDVTHRLINVSCCFGSSFFSLYFMPYERKIETAAAAATAAVILSACPHIDADDADDGVHLHAFHSPMSNQSEHNIIIFQILVVLFCLWLCHNDDDYDDDGDDDDQEDAFNRLSIERDRDSRFCSLHLPISMDCKMLKSVAFDKGICYDRRTTDGYCYVLATVPTKLPFKLTCRPN